MMRPQVSRTGVLALWSVLLLLGAATGHAQNGPKNGPAPASTAQAPEASGQNAIEGLDEERAADEKDRRERELTGDEEPERAASAWRAGRAVGRRGDRGPQVAAHRVQRRGPPEQDHGRDHDGD